MSKKEILTNLMKGSRNVRQRDTYRRFLLESLKTNSWNHVVRDIAKWLNHDNLADVEAALLDYLANDDLTEKQMI